MRAMRIAFYAPLKSPQHAVPSGDRRVARLLLDALERAGHQLELASTFRSFDASGDHVRQGALREEGAAIAQGLVARWRAGALEARPDLWFTYHVYYKAPDWLGPHVSAALGIPYVIAEASHAPKRAGGRWAIGHEAAGDAIRAADLVLCPTHDDVACLEKIVSASGSIRLLAPFLDPAPYRMAARRRDLHRARLSRDLGLDRSVPWIVVAAMMRPGDKLASYQMLARSLEQLTDLRWHLVVAGDGSVRAQVQAELEAVIPGRARFVGEQGATELAQIYAASDLCVWPAVNEAYGMAMLEAQAAGIPVVSRALRGVPDVVCDGRTGLLAAPDDEQALSDLTRALLLDGQRRSLMGSAAACFVATERSLDAAAARLDLALGSIAHKASNRSAAEQRT
ncbi:MAG: glycosyltransferase [Betaproteobacteria bacterium]|nr:glycosyltransferase [Betaproteobacteria bacterium]